MQRVIKKMKEMKKMKKPLKKNDAMPTGDQPGHNRSVKRVAPPDSPVVDEAEAI